MSDIQDKVDREQLLDREAEAWNAFSVEVARVPVDRREVNGVVEGWSVRDLVWHCGSWARFCGEMLETLSSPDFRDPFADHDDAYWDAMNDAIASEAKQMSWEQAVAAVTAGRERARAAFAAAPAGARPSEWFAEETFEHYEEHAEHIRRFLAG